MSIFKKSENNGKQLVIKNLTNKRNSKVCLIWSQHTHFTFFALSVRSIVQTLSGFSYTNASHSSEIPTHAHIFFKDHLTFVLFPHR